MGAPPCCSRSRFAALNGREPKKPERAESGEGCAVAMTGTSRSIGRADCASLPHRMATSGPPRSASA